MKKEKGAITLFVLLAMMFFVMALVSLFLVASSRAKLEKQITGQIQDSYQEDANTVYNSYFGGEVVPIYTAEQLLKIGSGEKNRINEENGKIYTFSKDATYVLKNNLEFSEQEMGLTESWYPIGEQIAAGNIKGRFEGNYLEIKVTDLNGEIYVYNRENGYKKILAPLPEDYVTSRIPGENTIQDGLVIYEMPEGGEINWDNQTITINGTTTNLLETVNQYVWIPVDDINSMIMCKSNAEGSICNMVLEGNTLKCTTHPETATDIAGRIYVGTRVEEETNLFSYKIDFSNRNQTYDENSGKREPAILTGTGTEYDGDSSNLETAGMVAGSSSEQFLLQLQNDFKEMATSVAKNGGFYISRYEIGANGESKKGQKVLTPDSIDGDNYLGANMWYGLYNTSRDIDNKKQMIWGCQYDQVIKFMGNEAQMAHSDRNITGVRALSGQNELDKMKNIYDLEGNCREWTLEADSTDQRIYRGGNCSVITTDERLYPASYRNITANEPIKGGRFWNNSCCTLFIKEPKRGITKNIFQNSKIALTFG